MARSTLGGRSTWSPLRFGAAKQLVAHYSA